MKITDIYDAIKEGTFEDFLEYYDGNINQTNTYTKLNLLQTAMLNDMQSDEKIRIIEFLISHGINVNYIDEQYGRNALHIFYVSVTHGQIEYLFQISKLLIKNGINLNQTDRYGAIPLSYLISVCKLTTESLTKLFGYLLKNGSDYNKKDNYGKSCLDYAEEFTWRNGFIKITEEYEHEKQ